MRSIRNMGKGMRGIVVSILVFSLMLGGCSSGTSGDERFGIANDPYCDVSTVVYDLGRSEVSEGKYLYFVAYYELVAQSMAQYYKESLGYEGDYFDEMYDDTRTEADYYKSLVEDTVIYYEIMKNAALDDNMSLSDDELADIKSDAKVTYEQFTKEQIEQSGITLEGIDAALRTMEMALKYEDALKKKLTQKDEFLALTTEEEAQEYIKNGVDLVYKQLKLQYSIVANGDVLDKYIIGSVTIVD